MLTGELPGKRLEAPSQKVSIDLRLDEIVLRAMGKEPELRYQQANVMKTRVEEIVDRPSSLGFIPKRNRPFVKKLSTPGIFLLIAVCVFTLIPVIFGTVAFFANFMKSKTVSHHSSHNGDTPTARTSVTTKTTAIPGEPSSRPLLMTEFGEFKSEQSLWSIRVSAQDRALYFSRQPGSSGIGISISPSKWHAQNGWFAFIEDENHAWAHDGGEKLMLLEVTPDKSTLYETEMILRTVPDAIQPLISQSISGKVGAKGGRAADVGKTEISGPKVAILAEGWLAGIDAGSHGQSWKDAAQFFQSAITESAWVAALEGVRKPLGAVTSRKIREVKKANSLPGAPDGEYFIIQFDTAFEAKAEAVETVTFKLE